MDVCEFKGSHGYRAKPCHPASLERAPVQTGDRDMRSWHWECSKRRFREELSTAAGLQTVAGETPNAGQSRNCQPRNTPSQCTTFPNWPKVRQQKDGTGEMAQCLKALLLLQSSVPSTRNGWLPTAWTPP